MREIDKDGLTISNIQGKVFEDSLEKVSCSSEIFIRRFMNSKISRDFDSLAILDDTITIDDIFLNIDNEFGISNYGSKKYNKEVLFWIGYIYRYFAYTYELSSYSIYKIVKPRELNELYYVYHTFDPKVAIERILEEKGISFNIEDKNKKLLKIIREFVYNNEILLENNNIINNINNENILKTIKYKDEIIGDVNLNKIDGNLYNFEYQINEKYKNKGIEEIIIKKTIKEAKELNIEFLIVKIPRNNENVIKILKACGFNYLKEDEFNVYFKRKI